MHKRPVQKLHIVQCMHRVAWEMKAIFNMEMAGIHPLW